MASASFPVIGRCMTWWGRELAACLPRAVREALAPPLRRLDATSGSDGLALRLRAGEREIIALTLDPEAPGARHAARRLAAGAAEITLRLPADAALYPRLHLPLVAAGDLRAAVAAEIDRVSPFPREAVLFDAKAVGSDLELGRLQVEALVVPRAAVEAALADAQALGLRADRVDGPRDAAPGERGFNLAPEGTARRRRPLARRLTGLLALLAAGLAALTVGLGYAARLIEANALETRLIALRERHDALSQVEARLADLVAGDRFLVAQKVGRPGTLALLAEISDRLPDDIWLHGLTYDAGSLRLEGVAPDASVLPNMLEGAPLLRGAAFAAPVTRDRDTGIERFTVTLTAVATTGVAARGEAGGISPEAAQ